MLASLFERLSAQNQKACGIFITNGFPNPQATLPILHCLADNGADFIELGMPFSDPLAEGLPIQHSSERALRHGVKMADAFAVAKTFTESRDTPLLLMGYFNPILRYGIEAFCQDAKAAGVCGLILPDLPPAESADLLRAAQANDLAVINLIAPNTTDERIRFIDEQSSGFVYAVSITGLTGTQISADAVSAYLQRVRPMVKNPLLVGFGIRSGADAQRLSKHTDGFIVGSAVIQLAEQLWDNPSLNDDERLNQLGTFVRSLKNW